MNLLKLAIGWLSLLPPAWLAALSTVVFAWAAVDSAGDNYAYVYWSFAGFEAMCALIIIWATWHLRIHTAQGGTA